MSPPPLWLSIGLPAVAFAILLWLERRRPLRRAVERTSVRLGRNLTLAAAMGLVVVGLERPALAPLTTLVAERRLGLLHVVSLPTWLEVGLAVVLMDYTLYAWHVLTHRLPWLWRMHVVHHVDLDMDASTALRFHAAEIAVSIVWRAGQIAVIGVSPLALGVWQTALLVSTLFHHANLHLPIELERRLVRVVVTPRMHGIHHSTVRAETDANWSNILTLWDRLHGTLRLNVPQEAVTIGVPAYRSPVDVGLGRLFVLPFGAQRPSWPGNQPPRPTTVGAQDRLVA